MRPWALALLVAGCAAAPLRHATIPSPLDGTAPRPPHEPRPPPEPIERPARLTVHEAVLEALAANRTVLVSRHGVAVADTRAVEARAVLWPEVRAVGTHKRLSEAPGISSPELGVDFTLGPGETSAIDVEASFPIFAFGRHLYAWRAARLAHRQAEADRDAVEADAAEAVTAAAYDLLETGRQIGVARSIEAALERQIKDAASLFAAEKVTKDALLEAEVEWARARRDREKLESLLPLRRIALNTLLGRPLDAPIEIVDAPVTAPPLVDGAGVLAARPESRHAELEVRRADAALRSAIGAELPQLRGVAAWHADDSDFSKPNDYGSLLLRLEIPLFRGGAGAARIRRARRELDVARLGRAETEARLLAAAAAARRGADEAYRDIAVAEQSVGKAEESHRILQERFTVGRATSRELLDSTALLARTRFEHVRSLYSYNVALSRLHRALGGDPRLPPFPAPAGSIE